MNAVSIRITNREGNSEQVTEIDLRTPPALLSTALASNESIDDDAMVPGNADDMASALTQIATELKCDNNLDDMLHAIDRLKPPTLEWSKTLCDGKPVNYASAEQACAALGPGWRLPTRMDLESILDLTRHDPAIDTEKFPDTQSAYYWSSTPCAWSADYAWIVSFSSGNAYSGYLRGYYACVRAVRAAPVGQ